MSICVGNNPGTNISSGHTNQITRRAIQCDQARILAKLQGNNSACCTQPPRTNKAALYASILTQDAVTACQPTPEQFSRFPKVGVPESVRIQKTQTAALECSVNPLDPNTRFSDYRRWVPNPPCVLTPAETYNARLPKPTYFGGCDPGLVKFF
jgi:hypothetical protein